MPDVVEPIPETVGRKNSQVNDGAPWKQQTRIERANGGGPAAKRMKICRSDEVGERKPAQDWTPGRAFSFNGPEKI